MILNTYFSIQVGARTILGEARGEPREAQLGVAHVLHNRLMDGRWGNTLASVAQHPWQFSCWNANDPNREFMLALDDSDPRVLMAVGLLGEALGGLTDPTRGAKWYKNVGLAWPKDWGVPRPGIATLGHLEFFNLDASR